MKHTGARATAASKSGRNSGRRPTEGRSSAAKASPHQAASSAAAEHTERESHPWEIYIPDHPQRTDGPTYAISRKLMNNIVGEVKDFYLGADPPYQDHHGGGLWVKDREGWLVIKNLAGLEWSQQFCADPKKIDKLRQFAQRIYRAFPGSIPALHKLVHGEAYPLQRMLDEEITTHEQVARWVDSIFNASVPPSQRRQLHRRWIAQHQQGKHLQFDGDHPLAKQAFARQT